MDRSAENILFSDGPASTPTRGAAAYRCRAVHESTRRRALAFAPAVATPVGADPDAMPRGPWARIFSLVASH